MEASGLSTHLQLLRHAKLSWMEKVKAVTAAAIHDAAGPGLLAACRASPEVSPRVRCPTGEARITK